MALASFPRPAPPAPRKGIVWLASYPRSGNTWLRFFIHSLLEVMQGVADEDIKITGIGKYSQWEAEPANFLPFVENPMARESFPQVAAARPRVQQAMLDRERSSFFVKTHLVLANVNGTPTINTRVTKAAVYLVRDPRDVACSLAAHLGWTLDTTIEIMAAADYVPANGAREVVSSWSRNVESWTTPARPEVLVARYEDLLSNPMGKFRSIASHVSINPADAQLERAIRLSSFGRLKQQQSEFGITGPAGSTDNFFRRGIVGGWRDQLSPAQAEKIVTDHREQMARFGYLAGD